MNQLHELKRRVLRKKWQAASKNNGGGFGYQMQIMYKQATSHSDFQQQLSLHTLSFGANNSCFNDLQTRNQATEDVLLQTDRLQSCEKAGRLKYTVKNTQVIIYLCSPPNYCDETVTRPTYHKSLCMYQGENTTALWSCAVFFARAAGFFFKV